MVVDYEQAKPRKVVVCVERVGGGGAFEVFFDREHLASP